MEAALVALAEGTSLFVSDLSRRAAAARSVDFDFASNADLKTCLAPAWRPRKFVRLRVCPFRLPQHKKEIT